MELKNIESLINLGYDVENVGNLNRVYRVKNSYGDLIATGFKESGLVIIETGKIFNYSVEFKKLLTNL